MYKGHDRSKAWLRTKVFIIIYEGKYSQRCLEESRAWRERSRSNMASRLNQTIRGEGVAREEAHERKTKERTKREESKRAAHG